jgi:hypothetical protein
MTRHVHIHTNALSLLANSRQQTHKRNITTAPHTGYTRHGTLSIQTLSPTTIQRNSVPQGVPHRTPTASHRMAQPRYAAAARTHTFLAAPDSTPACAYGLHIVYGAYAYAFVQKRAYWLFLLLAGGVEQPVWNSASAA